MNKLIMAALSLLVLSGCSSRIDEVDARMKQLHAQPPIPVPPPPTFLPVPTYAYSAQQLRSRSCHPAWPTNCASWRAARSCPT